MTAAARAASPPPLRPGTARDIVGAVRTGPVFGQTSKLEAHSYGLDAFACRRGSELARLQGTPCSKCYARRHFYRTWTPVIKNRQAHQAAVAHPRWSEAMAWLLEHYLRPKGQRYFRLHDSGDLVDGAHLDAVVDLARRVPWLAIWMPTHEAYILAAWVAVHGYAAIPSNLTIRLSADFNDAHPDQRHAVSGGLTSKLLAPFPTSTTHSVLGQPVPVSDRRSDSIECKAHEREHKCGPCRACWSRDVGDTRGVRNVSYPVTTGTALDNRGIRSPQLRLAV